MKREIYVVLDNIRSRENVGSIFRTADAAGVSKVYLCGTTPCPPHEKISKTALGAETYVPWEYYKQTGRLIDKLKKEALQVFGLENSKDAKNIFQLRSSTPKLALILGNEVRGLSATILKKCDKKIAIPMYGRKESLNVAVAAGIAVYTILSV